MVDPASASIMGVIPICVESANFAGLCSAAACEEVERLREVFVHERQFDESFKKIRI